MDVEAIAGSDWAGWSFGRDGLLYAPEWRAGLGPGDIRALPYLNALAADHRRQQRECAELRRQVDAVARLAGFYRRQLVAESRLGLMLLSRL